MAVLRDTKPRSQMFKYVEATVESVESSMSKNTAVSARMGGKPVDVHVKDNEVNRTNLGEFARLCSLKTDSNSNAACNIELEIKESDKTTGRNRGLKMGLIDKPSKPSRGDIGEAVIAAAIFARFVFKHDRITTQKVMDIMKTLGSKGIKAYPGKTGKYVETVFKSQNKGMPKLYDDVHCYISLNKAAITASLMPKSNFGVWAYKDVIPDLAKSASAYVNSSRVAAWAETVYTNMRYDKIDIRSDGLGDQKGTKVDTRVKITDQEGKLQPVNINLSMKVDDVKQFGQVSGMTFSVQQELWKQLFGYTSVVDRLESKWNELAQESHDLPGALNMVYDKVYEQVGNDLSGPKRDELIKTIAEGITYFATRHEEHVELLNLGKGGTKLYKFDEFYDTLVDVEDLKATIKTQKNNLRQMSIVGKSPNSGREMPLLSIRIRREPDAKRGAIVYIRNLIEKQKLLGDLLAESYD